MLMDSRCTEETYPEGAEEKGESSDAFDMLGDKEDSLPDVYEDENCDLPIRFFPPADGWCYFDELPAEILFLIFSYFTPGSSVCSH